jgi:hypothetical protein
MKTKTVVLIGGYSRSGKTSILSELSKRYPVASTSQYLDLVCSSLLCYPSIPTEAAYHLFLDGEIPEDEYYVPVLIAKNDPLVLELAGMTCRNYKIHVAEDIIVPAKTRDMGIVFPTLCKAIRADDPLIFFETIGGEESEILKKYLLAAGYKVKSVNIVCKTGVSGNDIRKPLKEAESFLFEPEEWYSEFEGISSAYRLGLTQRIIWYGHQTPISSFKKH